MDYKNKGYWGLFRMFVCILCFAFWTVSAFAQVNFMSSDLPIMIIETAGGADIPDEPKIVAQMKLINNDNGQKNLVTDPGNEYDGRISIEIRGSSSASLFPKKGYGFETQFADGSNNNIELLGMPSENDWVLHGPYSDKTLMRNALAYIFAGEIMAYAPRVRHLEMVVNGEYRGVYLLTEKIKRDKDRVDISKLRPEDTSGDQLTGGFIVKVDKFTGNSTGWTSAFPYADGNGNHRYVYHDPKFEELEPVQRDYIENFIFDFESVMDSPTFNDSLTGYTQWIDEDTFIEGFFINEIGKNVDAYRLSTYLYKDRDSIDTRLKFGPVWDFNLAFGNADYCEGGNFIGWGHEFNTICPGDGYRIPFYWEKLLDDERIKAKIKTRWLDLRQNEFSTPNLCQKIDSLATLLDESQQRNFIQWDIIGEYIWPNGSVQSSYANEVAYLKDWLIDRVQWMDINIDRLLTNSTDNIGQRFMLYPNPSSSTINFDIPLTNNISYTLKIHDVSGRLLIDRVLSVENLSNKITNIDIGELATGSYIYSLYLDENVLNTGVIQKISN